MKALSGVSNYDDKGTLEDQFGTQLHQTDTAHGYDVAESLLYQKGERYYWLNADDCSCWDGRYEGWSLTKNELLKLAKKRAQDPDGWSGADHEKLMAQWILENINGTA